MNRIFKKIFLILTIAWMTFIFSMSMQDADESSGTSIKVGETICSVFVTGYDDMTPEQQYKLAASIDHPVRKAAHATEYAILGILVTITIILYKKHPSIGICLCAIAIVFLYACSDEIHQLFVPGRSGQFTDVLIDTSGGAIGLLISLAVVNIIRHHYNNHKK